MSAVDRCPLCGDWWAEHKPAGCYARKNVNEWCKCTAPGDGAPRRRKPFPGGVENTVGGFVLFRPDNPLPPGVERADDGWVLTAGSRTPGSHWYWQARDGNWLVAPNVGVISYKRDVPIRPVSQPTPAPVGAPSGDDTPAPTAGQWTVDHNGRPCWQDRQGDVRPLGDLGVLDPTDYAAARDALVALVRRAEAAPDLTGLPTAEQVVTWLRENKKDAHALCMLDVLAAVAALVRDTPETDDG